MSQKINIGWAIISLLMSMSVLLVGCSQGTAIQEQPESVADGDIIVEKLAASDAQSSEGDLVASNGSDELQVRDNRSESEITQSELAALVEDGTYVEQRTYQYHAGEETVTISVTVENDIITNASVQASEDAHSVSQKYINGVNNALPELVFGKRIDQIDLPKQISGSSLTTAAFKQYVEDLYV